ncbi:MAG: flagellar hook-associated protein FlgL [bacterium]|nr:flagellar hook-associated protein FlgL [bacterium]
MRISTSELYNQQTAAIDNLFAQQVQFGQELSTGKQLNVPSDDPTQIGQDLLLHATQAFDQTVSSTVTNAQQQLSTIDGALSNLTGILQSARQIAIQGATETLSQSQRAVLGVQVDNLLQRAIDVGNTQVGGTYIFAGTSQSGKPFQGVGSPITSVGFSGNQQTPTNQIFVNGQTYDVGVSARQTFNLGSTDGSPDVFQLLIRLRDTINGQSVIDESGAQLNKPGTVISAVTGVSSAAFATPLVADATGNDSFQINGVTVTINQGTATVASLLTSINAVSASTGVTASFDYAQERLLLASSGGRPFTVADVPSAGANAPGNFVAAFGLQTQGSFVTDLSTQLGEVDRVMGNMLNGRAVAGATLQSLAAVANFNSTAVVNNTQAISGIEDADVAKVATEFSQAQAALQAAYGTTTRLEQHSLFDYLR